MMYDVKVEEPFRYHIDGFTFIPAYIHNFDRMVSYKMKAGHHDPHPTRICRHREGLALGKQTVIHDVKVEVPFRYHIDRFYLHPELHP